VLSPPTPDVRLPDMHALVAHVQYMCWVELLIAQVANPQASFLGHVCGILAGLLHVKVTSKWVARFRRFTSVSSPDSASLTAARLPPT
jgi:hypothetical protein